MKKLLYRCWLLLAFIFPNYALFADELITNDTLIIRLESGSQIKIVAFDFKKLMNYTASDSLMKLFYDDFDHSIAGLSSENYPKEVHYLISENGKRRMKLQEPDYAEQFDLAKEAYRLNQQLSSIHLVIYDLKNNVQIHLYPQQYTDINIMKNLSINQALKKLSEDKKEVKRTYIYKLKYQLGLFEKIKIENTSHDQLEIHGDANAMLIGNQWTPHVGLEARLMFFNRFKKPSWSIGLVWSSYGFSNFSDGNFKGFTYNTGLDTRLMFNMNEYGEKVNWLGLELGVILAPSKSEKAALNGTSYKLMIHNSYNGFGYSFGTIIDGNKNWVPAVGIKLPF